jgi:histidinol dehydrogenase
VTSPAGATALRLRRLDLADVVRDPAVAAERDRLVRRGAVPDPAVRAAARQIVVDVKAGGDEAVRAANRRFGGGLPDGRLTIERSDLLVARDGLPADVRRALDMTIANVERFAWTQLPATNSTTIAPGISIERRWTPVARVGAYVPGGSAAYPSSLVMCAVPARVAGVGSLVIASPAGADGSLDPVLLGTAGLLDVTAFVVAGGAQAVAALAFGLPEARIAPVDKIVGPGNAWVTAAKLEVFGEVGIDLPAGPSEVMVLADGTADPAFVAADLLSQAEHGPDSPAVLVTVDAVLAEAVDGEIGRQLETAPRRAILERSLVGGALVVLAPTLEAAVEFVNDYAPEHLTVLTADADAVARLVRNAGSVFIGPYAPESAGDYASGANHVLPTGGLARSSGPLGVEAFGKFSQVQRIDREGLASIRQTVTTLAGAEGLPAHSAAVEIRLGAKA